MSRLDIPSRDQRRDLPFPAGQQAGRALAARRARQFVGVRHRELDHEVERAVGAARNSAA